MKKQISISLKSLTLLLLGSLFFLQAKAQPGSGCKADWNSHDTTGGCTQYFYNTSAGTNNNTTYTWGFGDGQTSNQQNPAHTYTASGTYNVCLTISVPKTNGIACWDSLCRNVTVQCGAPGPCTANWDSYDTTGSCTEHFYNSSLGTNSNTTYHWSFGDGQTSTLQNPAHTYASSGIYWVCLYINVPLGNVGMCSDTLCKYVTVQCGTNGISSSEQIDISLSVNNPIFSFADIHYSIPSGGTIELALFNILGNKIGILESGNKNAGIHSYSFSTGSFAKGMYFLNLSFKGVTTTRKIVIAE